MILQALGAITLEIVLSNVTAITRINQLVANNKRIALKSF